MIRRVRIATGIVLFTFVATHLLNHSLGLVSLDAMEAGRNVFLAFWRNPAISVVLYGALTSHVALAVWAVYERRSWRLRAIDWAQLGLGLLIPYYLASHVLNTRYANIFFGVDDSYRLELLIFFVLVPQLAINQTLLIVITWGHGLIGMGQWLRLKPWFAPWRDAALVLALLLPALAIAGVWVAGRHVTVLAQDDAWVAQTIADSARPEGAGLASLVQIRQVALTALFGAFAAALALRFAISYLARVSGSVQISYPGGRQVSVRPGASILEASRQNRIPHASVCGGRGRCSTCRVRISAGLDLLPAPSVHEDMVLTRIGAAPNVRLACQTRPVASCSVVPMLPPDAGAALHGSDRAAEHGAERDIVVMFADLRGFTGLTEEMLPYDVVFLLNRYFTVMGQAIESAGGYVDKFVGDGIMAWFALDRGELANSHTAITACVAMANALETLNRDLDDDLKSPLRIGIGLHAGPAVVGRMGYGRATDLTAIGDTVNTASRLEALTKDHGVQLVVSRAVARAADLDVSDYETRELTIRGREKPLSVLLVPDAAKLAASKSVTG